MSECKNIPDSKDQYFKAKNYPGKKPKKPKTKTQLTEGWKEKTRLSPGRRPRFLRCPTLSEARLAAAGSGRWKAPPSRWRCSPEPAAAPAPSGAVRKRRADRLTDRQTDWPTDGLTAGWRTNQTRDWPTVGLTDQRPAWVSLDPCVLLVYLPS